ncbi:MAG: hypothetical protein GWN12_08940 [Thermoplasmata archaeon]|nr:hypothetical protein [Thermoplasmata archaeon]NIS12163.1 hypothetical protein [Thermoplasmata archaeon]NIW88891.1 hypothetical protein [Thermoplasmata archaeon]
MVAGPSGGTTGLIEAYWSYYQMGCDRLAKYRIIVQGSARPSKGYERGPMLVMTRSEWIEVIRHEFLKMVRTLGILLLASYLLLELLIGWLWIEDPGFRSVLFIMTVVFGAMFLAMWIIILLATLRAVKRDPVWGLYERGIQVNDFIFVPYEEIESIDVKRRGLGPKETMVRLKMRYKPKGWARLTTPTLFMVKGNILTAMGIEELERRISGVEQEVEPPKLVLYGPRSGR